MMRRSLAGGSDLKSRRSYFLKRDKEAVASTVGTIMALLVFLTFLSLFTNSYIPVWMQANERSHMNEVLNQFGDLKGRIDNMIISAAITGQTGLNIYTPITLGSEGVPIFASPTAGRLLYEPLGGDNARFSVQFNFEQSGGQSQQFVAEGGGFLELWAPNRYYVQQWVAYENGAIIVKQPDGEVVRAFPGISLTKTGTQLTVSITQLDLLGTNASIAGTGSAGLNVELIYYETQEFSISTSNNDVSLVLRTIYGAAWNQYLDELCKKAGVTYELSKTEINDDVYEITLTIEDVDEVAYSRAYVQITIMV